ncbi:C19orf25 [Branchiostoma lanceolatum]|uniref:C19orf25 protein n=1 Tax=Branchiostoma lanceolatum TaxID=7740 RepID=A0A8K0EMW0_BRALA|nr:C19orf25 [Branchiostoma lanceolatum]
MNAMLGRGKKKVTLPTRPEPPTMAEILEDVNNAPEDDVAFTYFRRRDQGRNISFNIQGLATTTSTDPEKHGIMSNSFEEQSSRQVKKPSQISELDLQDDVDGCYEQARTYLELNTRLEKSKTELKQKCEDLEVMGSELTNSIQELKKQTEHSETL